MKKINVSLSAEHKKELEVMSEELRIAQSNLINLATVSMLENYKDRGSFIFVDILNPQGKKDD